MSNEISTTIKAVNAFGHAAYNAGQAAGIRRAIKEMREEFLKFNPALTLSLEVAIESLEAQALGLELNNKKEA